MRILMLSFEYPPHIVGGLGKHVADLLPALASSAIDVHLVTPVPPTEEGTVESGCFTVHRVPAPKGPFIDFYQQVLETNKSMYAACQGINERYGPFDLVHTHDWLTSFAAIQLKLAYKIPLLATIHATERGRGRGSLGSEMASRVNDAEWQLVFEAWRVICCTQYMVREVADFLQTPDNKIDVIPNGVDPRPFQAFDGLDLTSLRAQYAFAEEKLVFFVGRLVAEKGAESLVRAAPAVLRVMPNVRFVIAGRGPETAHLQQVIRELNLQTHVTLAGFISDNERDKIYKTADCAVFPSLYEPFGIVALEAMAARVPVVVSEVGGLREVVQHGETGITIYPNNPDSCAWGILHTLQNPEWSAMRVANAYQKVLSVYNWQTIAAQTTAVYQRVIAERAQTPW
ncbi:MAG: glycosyltransferase family 4 protein [Anaerolineae bacterium]